MFAEKLAQAKEENLDMHQVLDQTLLELNNLWNTPHTAGPQPGARDPLWGAERQRSQEGGGMALRPCLLEGSPEWY